MKCSQCGYLLLVKRDPETQEEYLGCSNCDYYQMDPFYEEAEG